MTTVGSPAFAPFTPSWDAPQLPAGDLATFPNAFEWWYFDLATDDGLEIVVVFSRQNPLFSSRKSSVYLEYKDAGRAFTHICNVAQRDFEWRESADGRVLRVGASSVRIIGDDARTMRYEVDIDLPWLRASLTMTPQHRGFLPSADGTYFRHRTDRALFTAVSFSAPLMRTVGEITVDGVSRPVSGRGYHDHPWGTQQLFWTHHEWNWARATTPAEGVMFADVTPSAEYEGMLTFLYVGHFGEFEPRITGSVAVTGSDWRKDGLLGLRFPHRLDVKTPTAAWQATAVNSLLDTPIYNRCAATWTPMPAGPEGAGWVEYFSLPRWARAPACYGARASLFFVRPFPWFGR